MGRPPQGGAVYGIKSTLYDRDTFVSRLMVSLPETPCVWEGLPMARR
jgi:hypothetical protein